MTRFIKMTLTVDETAVGGLMADLTDRVKRIDYEVVEIRDGRAKRGRPEDLLQFIPSKGATPKEIRTTAQLSEAAVSMRLIKLKKAKLVYKKDNLYFVNRKSKGAKA